MERAEKGCLVLHGLTGTPAVVDSVTDALKKAGFVVKAPMLAGHGTNPEALLNTSWQDWYGSALEAYKELEPQVKRVYCVGISLGSLLGLKLAVEWRWSIRALACISTPIKLATFVRVAFPLVWHTPIKHIYKFQSKDYMTSVADPEGRERYKEMSYDRMPLRSVAEIRLLQDVLKKELSTMATPLLMVHAKRDTVAPISNVDEIKKLVKSTIVEKLILERSHHVVTLDYERELVAGSVVDFFERFL